MTVPTRAIRAAHERGETTIGGGGTLRYFLGCDVALLEQGRSDVRVSGGEAC